MKKQKKTFYKKKQAKPVQKKSILPHILRIIPEWSFQFSLPPHYRPSIKKGVFFGLVVLFFLLIAINSFLFYSYTVLQQERKEALTALSSSEKLIQKHPERAEAYYVAALFAARLNEKEKAKEYLEQALFLNPHLESAKKLLEAL